MKKIVTNVINSQLLVEVTESELFRMLEIPDDFKGNPEVRVIQGVLQFTFTAKQRVTKGESRS